MVHERDPRRQLDGRGVARGHRTGARWRVACAPRLARANNGGHVHQRRRWRRREARRTARARARGAPHQRDTGSLRDRASSRRSRSRVQLRRRSGGGADRRCLARSPLALASGRAARRAGAR